MWPVERWQPTGEKPRVVEFISELIWACTLFTWPSLFQLPSYYNFLPQCLWFVDLIFKWYSVASPSLFMFFLFFHLYYCLNVSIHQLIFQPWHFVFHWVQSMTDVFCWVFFLFIEDFSSKFHYDSPLLFFLCPFRSLSMSFLSLCSYTISYISILHSSNTKCTLDYFLST